MRVYLPEGPEPDEQLVRLIDDEQVLKFVAFGRPDDGIASVFPHDYRHDGFVSNINGLVAGLEFQGAGRVYTHPAFRRGEPPDVEWGSASLREIHKRDRPSDPEIALRIEREIKEAVARIVREIMGRRTG